MLSGARVGWLWVALVALVPAPPVYAETTVPPLPARITYILPLWGEFLTAGDAQIAEEVRQLRARIGEGRRVRVGFSLYLTIYMSAWRVDVTDPAVVHAALAGTIDQIDRAIARARLHGIPICFNVLTALRSAYDDAQRESEAEDRRNMQWYADNGLAAGWWTHSRYARKQRRVQEAYVREIGRVLANRMAVYPDIVVAASGDGEVELSYERSLVVDPALTPTTSQLADYSPFTVAEFRDWLRHGGLYAPSQSYAGQGHPDGARYASDPSPGVDSVPGDGHTLNSDFGTSFTTWDLRYSNWSLSDDPFANPDPGAIPASVYSALGWQPVSAGADRFDAPRERRPGHAWWELWMRFRQLMIWRHNREFAEWITTSPHPGTGATVPSERWYSYQIPADYLFGHSPDNPDFRLETSASPWWTADVSPYGMIGITSFNVNLGGGNFARTLAGVAPRIAERGARWGILEWHPSVPASESLQVYRDELNLVERYHPSVLVPYAWRDPRYPIEGTGFETALREFVDRIRDVPLALSRPVLHFGATTTGLHVTPPQAVRVTTDEGGSPAWVVASLPAFLEADVPSGTGSATLSVRRQAYAPGLYEGFVEFRAADSGYRPISLRVVLEVVAAGTPPTGVVDTPAHGVRVAGEVPVTGWAVDDIGVEAVAIWRASVGAEPVAGNGLVYVGAAVFIDGSRTDVEAVFPTKPASYRAGWGFMLLTNTLPGAGNGVFTFYIFARDVEGQLGLLGTRTLVVDNYASTLPFGTIDTPGQGETVSGLVVNFGWALTPLPSRIREDGSTIDVYIDGVFRGHPAYGFYRSDIAQLFPGLANANGAVGYFIFDSRMMADGLHTIEWVIRDEGGRAQGVGSRFFRIQNLP